ncbi:unnamed protein product [Rhizoctonia solani]|uniref:Uncharacterized protein n=1 Tax=Rhizoctonia solani TaxID=456999 RepID=A0A8H2X244_9AGAM|nr:unnamed protein product [Rhizoctonia solani]CAE6436913.1 unnamed protein product [Rhizoctonia solani]
MAIVSHLVAQASEPLYVQIAEPADIQRAPNVLNFCRKVKGLLKSVDSYFCNYRDKRGRRPNEQTPATASLAVIKRRQGVAQAKPIIRDPDE